jgi:muconolactone delta-isomerase
VKSDTLQLIESSEFVKAIDTLDSRPKELWRILTKYGLYGVMFMTNEHEVIAVSVRKPLYIYATRDLLIFVNEPIQFARVVKRFGFKLSLGVVPQKSYRNIMIRYDVKRMKPLFFRPKPKPSKQKYDYDYLSQDWWWAWK